MSILYPKPVEGKRARRSPIAEHDQEVSDVIRICGIVFASPPVVAGGALVCASVFVLPGVGEAIPAYARQLHASCRMCHNPVPPRLNNVGILFKRMGYRLPDV